MAGAAASCTTYLLLCVYRMCLQDVSQNCSLPFTLHSNPIFLLLLFSTFSSLASNLLFFIRCTCMWPPGVMSLAGLECQLSVRREKTAILASTSHLRGCSLQPTGP
ncbi:uncharacterized protein BDZ83DRAFT_16196 [Colletotrichum acutatum]|uniref:Uncharacterized protein n=1 Tax=Glomerella acutata TaxID=27357 RepID=A0AAD8XLX4_GLOAC|nr:uncharacterized protein BDZ83DRAFT_16196 [Colletotrichum acutatum]KAK1729747.1 hypothetical protein BDZ83DRAFT_16196 [Colletotrichum acutatum]